VGKEEDAQQGVKRMFAGRLRRGEKTSAVCGPNGGGLGEGEWKKGLESHKVYPMERS